jgi:chromosomal replication initiation ATPase DnaA
MGMLYRHGEMSQAAIGRVLGGLDYTTVSRERKRLRERVQKDKRLAAAIEEVENILRHK